MPNPVAYLAGKGGREGRLPLLENILGENLGKTEENEINFKTRVFEVICRPTVSILKTIIITIILIRSADTFEQLLNCQK